MAMTRAIIRAGTYGAMTNPYIRAGATAYRYAPYIARAAGMATRFAYKSYRRRSRVRRRRRAPPAVGRNAKKRVGEPVGRANAKRTKPIPGGTLQVHDTRNLYAFPLTTIFQGTSNEERERGLVNLRGFKICQEIYNNTFEALYVNIAIVHPKKDPVDNGEAGVFPDKSLFFRANGSSRGKAFNDPTNSSLDFHCDPINTDQFNVIKHKRYKLAPQVSHGAESRVDTSHRGASYMTTKWWVPMKRQLRFNNVQTDTPEGGHIWLVWWADKYKTPAGAAGTSGAFGSQNRVITYFKDTRT